MNPLLARAIDQVTETGLLRVERLAWLSNRDGNFDLYVMRSLDGIEHDGAIHIYFDSAMRGSDGDRSLFVVRTTARAQEWLSPAVVVGMHFS